MVKDVGWLEVRLRGLKYPAGQKHEGDEDGNEEGVDGEVERGEQPQRRIDPCRGATQSATDATAHETPGR